MFVAALKLKREYRDLKTPQIFIPSKWFKNDMNVDERAISLIREATHLKQFASTDFDSSTKDSARRKKDALLLAKASPDQAVKSASNYEFYLHDAIAQDWWGIKFKD